jgi:HAE1 family hydrophobic/amphiphilic exporter-1
VVVLVFLRNRRSTFISGLAIPSSVIASFTFFYIADFTLNSMTLMALSLSIGLVIDDTIVVLESIFRKLEAGEEAKQAAERGTSEVGLAVVSTTLAVCAVFVPIAFMEATIGRFFREFGLVVVIAVSVSALVAFTLTPMLASRILRVESEPGPIFGAFERGLEVIEEGYRRLLAGALHRKGLTVSVALAAVAGGCGIATTLPFTFYTPSDMGEVGAKVKFPVGTPLPVTARLTRKMETALERHPDVVDVFAAAGGGARRTPNRASLLIILRPKTERDEPIDALFDELRKQLLAVVPEAEELSVGHAGYAGQAPGQAEYSLRGPDPQRLARYANQLLERMRADPDFADISSSLETGRPQITLDIERDRAADLGVPVVAIGRTIRALLAGEKIGSFEEGGRRHDIRMQILPEYRDDPVKLDLIRVRSLRGELVPLTNAVQVRTGEGPVKILRENRAGHIAFSANLAAGVPLGNVTQKIEAWGDEIGITSPDELAPAGHAESMKETGRAITFAFALAMVAIYMILASLFNSLTHPLTIMMSAPLSFIGGFLALKLAGMSLDMMSGIGLLVLMGLVMKNGILLVDYTNQLRERGRSLEAAILEAGPVRMRPVLMTSCALICGMLPVVLTNALGSEFRAPMGMITIGGLLTSTLLTLVVVPVIYSLIEAATTWSRQASGRLMRRAGTLLRTS